MYGGKCAFLLKIRAVRNNYEFVIRQINMSDNDDENNGRGHYSDYDGSDNEYNDESNDQFPDDGDFNGIDSTDGHENDTSISVLSRREPPLTSVLKRRLPVSSSKDIVNTSQAIKKDNKTMKSNAVKNVIKVRSSGYGAVAPL